MVPLALCRGADHRGGAERAGLPRHRHLWQAAAEPERRADPLVTPWKYGFKSIKSIVRFTFTDQRPKSFWEELAGKEYGFWANVNPGIPHPRWPQKTERMLGSDARVPTMIFNGYREQVEGLYANLGITDPRELYY